MPQNKQFEQFDMLANLIESVDHLTQTASNGNEALVASARQLSNLNNIITSNVKDTVKTAMNEAQKVALKDLHDTAEAAVIARDAYIEAARWAFGKVMIYALLAQVLFGGLVAGVLWLAVPHPSEIMAKRDELHRIEQRLDNLKRIGADDIQLTTCDGRPCVRINTQEKRIYEGGSYKILHGH